MASPGSHAWHACAGRIAPDGHTQNAIVGAITEISIAINAAPAAILFTIRMSDEAFASPIFGLVYTIGAIAVSSGTVYLLNRNRAALT